MGMKPLRIKLGPGGAFEPVPIGASGGYTPTQEVGMSEEKNAAANEDAAPVVQNPAGHPGANADGSQDTAIDDPGQEPGAAQDEQARLNTEQQDRAAEAEEDRS